MAAQMETARASMRPAEDLSRLERTRSLRVRKRRCWLVVIVEKMMVRMLLDG